MKKKLQEEDLEKLKKISGKVDKKKINADHENLDTNG